MAFHEVATDATRIAAEAYCTGKQARPVGNTRLLEADASLTDIDHERHKIAIFGGGNFTLKVFEGLEDQAEFTNLHRAPLHQITETI